MSEPTAILTEALSKRYRDFWGRSKLLALDSLDLSVRQGEVFGFLGPNGSGKTTTVKMLLGLIFPTSGRAEVLGQPPRHVQTHERIGFLPEESYLYRYLNAEETLDFYGRLFKIPRKERRQRIGALIERVGLADARKRPLKEYSKGMSRRIGLAQALINNPDLLFLDEPTSGMDPIGIREVKDIILELKREGKTIFLCSHLLAHVEDVCDRVAILYRGKLRTMGAIEELLRSREVIQALVEGAGDAQEAALRAALEGAGLTVREISAPRTTLEDVFLKTVEEATPQERPRA